MAQYTLLLLFLLAQDVTSLLNGDDTDPGDYPFMVWLSSPWYPTWDVCGASLISSRTVLTAAHCIEHASWRTGPDDLLVTLGDYDRKKTDGTEKRMEVSRIIVHEGYRRGMLREPYDDIALIILKEEVKLEKGGDYSVIALPTDRTLYEEGTKITVIGWGWTDRQPTRPNTLKKIEQVIPDQEACQNYWEAVGTMLGASKGIPAHVIADQLAPDWMEGMFCTGKQPLAKRMWYGDSGGPLFVEVDGTFTQLAVFSWNNPEDTEIAWDTDYDVSVDLFFYLDWIKQNMV